MLSIPTNRVCVWLSCTQKCRSASMKRILRVAIFLVLGAHAIILVAICPSVPTAPAPSLDGTAHAPCTTLSANTKSASISESAACVSAPAPYAPTDESSAPSSHVEAASGSRDAKIRTRLRKRAKRGERA
jgi:hypothetical protein